MFTCRKHYIYARRGVIRAYIGICDWKRVARLSHENLKKMSRRGYMVNDSKNKGKLVEGEGRGLNGHGVA